MILQPWNHTKNHHFNVNFSKCPKCPDVDLNLKKCAWKNMRNFILRLATGNICIYLDSIHMVGKVIVISWSSLKFSPSVCFVENIGSVDIWACLHNSNSNGSNFAMDFGLFTPLLFHKNVCARSKIASRSFWLTNFGLPTFHWPCGTSQDFFKPCANFWQSRLSQNGASDLYCFSGSGHYSICLIKTWAD